jgi:hypothetical protein
LDAPALKRVPRRVVSVFAASWASLLSEAVYAPSLSAWFRFFAFPRAVLLPPPRGGRRLVQRNNETSWVRSRLQAWPSRSEELYQEVVSRSQKCVARRARRAGPSPYGRTERAALRALRLGDVRKALQALVAAPIAPSGEPTLKGLTFTPLVVCLRASLSRPPRLFRPTAFWRRLLRFVPAPLRAFLVMPPSSCSSVYGQSPRRLVLPLSPW